MSDSDSGCDEEYFVKNMKPLTTDQVGETLDLYWIPEPQEEGYGYSSCVYEIISFDQTTSRFRGRTANCRGEGFGQEENLPKKLFYIELSDFQKAFYIEPKEKRIRAEHPISLCPDYEGQNYEITDPERSFLVKADLQKTQEYYIHDNMGIPFRVLAHEKAIEIYAEAEEPIWDEERIYNKRIACYTNFIGIWPGYDAMNYSKLTTPAAQEEFSSYFSGFFSWFKGTALEGQADRVDGTNVLIQLTPTKYVHVGDTVYSFETETPIINYYSSLGWDDVPYSVAYGENKVYFMRDYEYMFEKQLYASKDINGAKAMCREFHGGHLHNDEIKKDCHDVIEDDQSFKMKNLVIMHERMW